MTLTAEELCSRYAPAVCRFAALLAMEPADAEDLAQDVLVKAIRALPKFDPARGSVEAWLWRVASNAARDRQRSEWRRRLLWNRLVRLRDPELESIENGALNRLDAARVKQSLASLSHRERFLLSLRYGADLDYETMGSVVGMSAEAVRKGTERTIQRLRMILEVRP